MADRTPRTDEFNLLLRRLDWRFLLPGPPPRTVCCRDPLHGRATALVWAPVEAGADLVVLANARRSDLCSARTQLGAGGSVYVEWRRPVIGGAGGARRMLRDAGFTDVACYWAWPPPHRGAPHFWIPLRTSVIEGFLSTRPEPRTLRARIGVALRVAAWRIAHRLGLLVPLCAVGRVPPAPDPGLFERLHQRWIEWGIGETPVSLHRLLLAPGLRASNKAVVSVFANEERTPRLVVKLARTEKGATSVAHEAENLRALERRFASARPRGIPALLFHERRPISAVGQSRLAGRPLSSLLQSRSFAPLALAVTDWLVALAATTQPVAPRSAWWSSLVQPALDEFEETFSAVVTPTELRRGREVIGTLGNLPLVWEHRDCSPWNVLVDDSGAIAMPDWESAVREGLPVLDLVYFLSFATFFVDGAMDDRTELLASYRRMRSPGTPAGRVASQCRRRYIQALDLVGDALSPLQLLTWVVHSRAERLRILEDHGEHAQPDALGHSLFLALWREELAAKDLEDQR